MNSERLRAGAVSSFGVSPSASQSISSGTPMRPRNSAMVSTSACACSVTLVEKSAKPNETAAIRTGTIAAKPIGPVGWEGGVTDQAPGGMPSVIPDSSEDLHKLTRREQRADADSCQQLQ